MASNQSKDILYGSDLGNCGTKTFDMYKSEFSVTIQLDDNEVSWNGEWVEIYFQNLYWAVGAPWEYVRCDLSGVELNQNNAQHKSTCSQPMKYLPG